MLVYHGTSEDKLKGILTHGIKPRGRSGISNWKQTVESNPDTVYLTDAYGLYFALNALNHGSGRAVLLELDSSDLPGTLVADEDALEQVSRNINDGLPRGMSMPQRTRHYRSMTRKYADYGFDHEWSLKTLGTMGHIGDIPPECIRRVALIDTEVERRVAFWAMDTTVSVMGHMASGWMWRSLTRQIFGYPPGEPEFDEVRKLFQLPSPGAGIELINVKEV